jgi:hypothetical protein
MNFAAAADDLHRQEFARLAEAVTPRLEAFRSMTASGFRNEIALMLERVGHAMITSTPELVTVKNARKYITACAVPTDPAPTRMPALRRLHEAIVAANAARGFYVTPRGFTPEAEHYAESAPLDLVDGALLIRSMHRSRKGVLLPQTYKAMCRQCGEIMQYKLGDDRARPCGIGHFVVPTIARADLVKQPTAQHEAAGPSPAPSAKVAKWRNMSAKAQRRRAIKAHNHRAQAIRHRGG